MRIRPSTLFIQLIFSFAVQAYGQTTADQELAGIQASIPSEELTRERRAAEKKLLNATVKEQAEQNTPSNSEANPFAKGFRQKEWTSFLRSGWDQWVIDARVVRRDLLPYCAANKMISDFQYRSYGNFITEEANRIRWVYNDASRMEGRGETLGEGVVAANTRIGVHIGLKKIELIKLMSLRRVEQLKRQTGLTTAEITEPQPDATILAKIARAGLSSSEHYEILALRDYGPYLIPSDRSNIIRSQISITEMKLQSELTILNFVDPNRSDLANIIKENHFDITMANHYGAYSKNLSLMEKAQVVIVKVGTSLVLLTYAKVAAPVIGKIAPHAGKFVYGIISVKVANNLKKLLWNYVAKMAVGGLVVASPTISKYLLYTYLASNSDGETEKFAFYSFTSAMQNKDLGRLGSDYLGQITNLCDVIRCHKQQTELRNRAGHSNTTSDYSQNPDIHYNPGKTASHDDWIRFCEKTKQQIIDNQQNLARRQTLVYAWRTILHNMLPSIFGVPQ